MLIIAEIGDVRRFPTARHLCAWAGLTPTVRSSDGKARLGNISRQGSSILRWAVIEAATHVPTRGGPLRQQFERIAKRRGRKVARVAVARQILTLCYTAYATARSAISKPPVPASPIKVLTTPGPRSPSAHLIALPGREPELVHARASSFLSLASPTRTAAHLIEPPRPRTTLWSALRDRMECDGGGPPHNEQRDCSSNAKEALGCSMWESIGVIGVRLGAQSARAAR